MREKKRKKRGSQTRKRERKTRRTKSKRQKEEANSGITMKEIGANMANLIEEMAFATDKP